MEISPNQPLGEVQYADLQRQLKFDDHTLMLCCIAALSAWNRVEKSGKISGPVTKIIQDPKEAFIELLQLQIG